jgi:hypothetical protein
LTQQKAREERMFKKILIGLIILVGAFAVYVAMQPDELVIERQATIKAPPATVFANVNEMKKWDAWSPWAKIDPNAKMSFVGPAAGKDATFKWSGNEKVGEGQMVIVDSQPDQLVDIKVNFTKPFENTSNSTFAFKPQGDQTLVTWRTSGKQNFIEKAMCIAMNGKKMLAGEMDKGLANLTAVSESGASVP